MGFKPLIKLTGHNASIYNLIDLDKDYFLSLAGDGFIVKWHKYGNEPNGKLIANDTAPIYCGILKEGGTELCIGNMQGIVSLLDLKTSKVISSVKSHKGSVYTLSQTDIGYISGGQDGYLVFYDHSLKMTHSLKLSSKSVRCIYKDISLLYVGCSDSQIYKVNLETYQVTKLYQHQSSIFSIELFNNFLLSGGRDAKLHILDMDSYESRLIDAHLSTINKISVLKDLVITASKDKTIRIWDNKFKLIQSLNAVLGGHINSVNSLLPIDEITFVSCSDDRSIIIWKDIE